MRDRSAAGGGPEPERLLQLRAMIPESDEESLRMLAFKLLSELRAAASEPAVADEDGRRERRRGMALLVIDAAPDDLRAMAVEIVDQHAHGCARCSARGAGAPHCPHVWPGDEPEGPPEG